MTENSFKTPILAPSILAADFTRLGAQIDECTQSGTKWIHCDIMDGHFVPNISYGPMIVQAARRAAPHAFLDVHLMIYNPDFYLQAFADAGADLISVHVEATPHVHRSLQHIKSLGLKTGIAINPGTPVSAAESVLTDADLVVLMSVNPGFGGQSFIEATWERIRELVALRVKYNLSFLIEIDGGVTPDNAGQLLAVGADVLVAGSSVFGADDIPARIRLFEERMQVNVRSRA
jgi:ribulose-phosphate 3-epimerase